MSNCTFKIKIALLGHVSVGKTTLLNALLGDKFSEVSKKRTTAGINHFHLSAPPPNSHFMKASNIFAKIVEDNQSLRENAKIHEKNFYLELDKPIIKMTDNCDLVITDVPGLNEAGTKDMYLNFVKKSWDTFDCAVIVMDSTQGVNTEDQIKLLQFVKANLKNEKDIPVIILCNKVDDPFDNELMSLVQEVQLEVENIFKVSDRKEALESILDSVLDSIWQIIEDHSPKRQRVLEISMSPVFIPISAENAFLYRIASQMTQQDLSNLDQYYLDKIGQEEVGRFKWKRLSNEEKIKIVADVVNDPEQYEERLASSNFDKFITAIEYFIKGAEKQGAMLEKQLEVELKKLSFDGNFGENILSIFERGVLLGKPMTHLNSKFWELYGDCEKMTFEAFSSDPSKLSMLYAPMEQLKFYSGELFPKICNNDLTLNKVEGEKKIILTMKTLVVKFISIVTEKFEGCTWYTGEKEDPWEYLHHPLNPHWKNNETGETTIKNSSGTAPRFKRVSSTNNSYSQYPTSGFTFGVSSTNNFDSKYPTSGFTFGSRPISFDSSNNNSTEFGPKPTSTSSFGVSGSSSRSPGNIFGSCTPTTNPFNSAVVHPEADKYRSHWEWNEELQLWKSKYTTKTFPGTKDIHPFDRLPTSWNLYYREWSHIISSILVMKYDKKFCETFSEQISNLEWLTKCPIEQKDYINKCRLPMSNGPASEESWGHLIYMFCN